MREKLNENPVAQVALVAILVLVGGYFFISSGGEEEEAATSEATVAVAGTGVTATATGSSPGEAVEGAVESLESGAATSSVPAAVPTSIPSPPLPRPLLAAYDSGKTVVLLIVDRDGIDDRLVTVASSLLAEVPDTATFVVPAGQIARYAAITVGLDVNRVPALVVMRPKRLSGGTPQASVTFGFQTPQSIVQAVRDASYEGPEATYHPD